MSVSKEKHVPGTTGLKLIVSVQENGEFLVDFINLWLPANIKRAQHAITMSYGQYRTEMAKTLNRAKLKEKQRQMDNKVKEREDKALKNTEIQRLNLPKKLETTNAGK